MSRAIVVMARLPALGRVKTRIAAALGEAAALDLYRAFLADGVAHAEAAAVATGAEVWVAVDGGPPEAMRPHVGPGARLVAQPALGLGDRILAAHAAPAAEAAVVLGSDVPLLAPERIAEAFAALDAGAELALAPSDDGGFDLIAARRLAPAWLAGVDWSTPAVLEQTLKNARAAGASAALLQGGFDLDDRADLERACRELSAAPERAPETARALARWLEPRLWLTGAPTGG